MATKRKAAKKAKSGKANGKGKRKKVTPGDPIIINGGGGKKITAHVTIGFDHEGFGPDPVNPANCNRWVNEEVTLDNLVIQEDGGTPRAWGLSPTDLVTIRCANAAGNAANILITGTTMSVAMEFDRMVHRYRRHRHSAPGYSVTEVLITGGSIFTTTLPCIVNVNTRK